MQKMIFFLTVSLLLVGTAISQEKPGSPLLREMQKLDSLLFEVAFNHCNTAQLEKLTADNFEFYHDKGGVTLGKQNFVNSVKTGVCNNNYRAIRKLVPGTMQVFPLYKDGQLYGAIQMADHEFWAEETGKPLYMTSTAKFTHLWMLENGEWKFYRGLSYDHQPAKQ